MAQHSLTPSHSNLDDNAVVAGYFAHWQAFGSLVDLSGCDGSE